MANGGYVIPFEAKLKCSICKELITDARSLSCGHTFCKDCLNKRSPSPGGTLSCSKCTEKSQLPSGGVEQLPRCYVINGLLDAIQQTFRQGGDDKEVSIGRHGFQLEENFSCAICLTLMTDPRYLPCGHSFCVGCLMRLHRSQGTSGIKCSHCKVKHVLTSQGVNSLPIGHRIKSIAEEIKSNKGEPTEPQAKQKDRKDDCDDENRRAQDQYQIFLRQLNGKTVTLDIDRNASISDLEEKVRTRTGVEPEQFSLTHNGRTCERSRSLSYYNISNHDTVNMTTKLAGGRAVNVKIEG